jgi:hypothetical protein
MRIQGVPGMFAKELRIRRKQAGIQDLQNPGKVNLGVFRVGMIAMNQEREGGQQQQAEDAADDTFDVQSRMIHLSMRTENYNRKLPRQEAGIALAARINPS